MSVLNDDGYRQLMKHAQRLAQSGHDELAQHLRDMIGMRADAERLCWLIDTADSSWTVEMFETFETGEIRNVIDIAMSATAQLAR